jgi:hypothetical protein
MSDGWIGGTGKRPDLPKGTRVEFMLDGDDNTYIDAAADLYWGPGDGRIVRWRVVGTVPGVGDVNSTERGSAARYNTGKPPLELIPAEIVSEFVICGWQGRTATTADVIRFVGQFQMRKPSPGLTESETLYATLVSLPSAGSILEDAARVFDYGRRKYAAWNWIKGQAWSIPIGSAMRHLLAIQRGEELDPESGLPHAGHAACNVIMLLWYIDHYPEGDDRVPAERVAAA